MAIELGAIVPMPAVARSAGRTGGAEGAQGSGSFASALSGPGEGTKIAAR